ncbi:MAG: DUF3048 domain-containing protein [Epulopiscium sp.]|nr:DUF3048 domain-containing protein [Candidatus Epulonipiscium sp.]
MQLVKRGVQQIFLVIGVLFFLLIGFTSCKKKSVLEDVEKVMQEETNSTKKLDDIQKLGEENSKDLHIGQSISPLTGLWIDEKVAQRRPVAVMINNHKKAWPHHGLSQAEVIYETLVEGEMTRLMALFQNFDVEKIGPIRSARHYYLDFAFDHDAIYVHYGQSVYAHRAFQDLKVDHLNGLSWLDEIMCWRDRERWQTKGQEHSAFTNTEKIMTAWDQMGYRYERKEDFPLLFQFFEEDTSIEGKEAMKISLPFSYYLISEFEYDENKKTYKRFQSGEPHIDGNTGEQLNFKNIIIQFVDIWMIAEDPNFCRDMNLLSKGEGLYITNGKMMPIKWSKSKHKIPTNFFDFQGNPLQINKGNTWISIYPKNQKYEIQ